MDQRIGVSELFTEGVAKRNARDLLAGDRIQHDEIIGKHRQHVDRRGQPKHLEHAEHVGSELNAGADLLELGRLLDDLRGDAFAMERQRRAQAADAAADDDDRLVLPMGHASPPRVVYLHLSPPRGEWSERTAAWHRA